MSLSSFFVFPSYLLVVRDIHFDIGLCYDLGLSSSVSLWVIPKSFLKASVICWVIRSIKFFGKTSPINGFDVFTSYRLSRTRFIILT